jgi:hypothetical protein
MGSRNPVLVGMHAKKKSGSRRKRDDDTRILSRIT